MATIIERPTIAVPSRQEQQAGAPPPSRATLAARPPERPLHLWEAYALVFISSACTLVIEILAGRLLAPYLGVSLYTWTSIIGVILAGITVGNYVGGALADRAASRALLRRLYLYSVVTVIAIIVLAPTVADRLSVTALPLMLRIVLTTVIAFLVPATILGTITPIVVKLSLHRLDDAGLTVGRIYAVSAAGSIGGTFLTGFLLIDLFGSRVIIMLVAATLLLCGLVVAPWRVARAERILPALVLAFLLLATPFLYAVKALPGPCATETSYFCIRTEQIKLRDGRLATGVFLDRLMHSSLILDDPNYLGYDYQEAYRVLTDDRLARNPSLNLLVIGAGGYAFPRYMVAQHPQASVEVLEIDPGVVRFNQERLGLPTDSPIVSHSGDARLFLNGANGPAPRNKYAVIHEDAINDVSVPYHLTTLEFHRLVKQSMTPDGLYLVNLIDSGRQGRFVQAYVNTVQQVFGHVVVYALDGQVGRPGHATFVIAASDGPVQALPIAGWTAFAPDDFARQFIARVDLILTDDHAPVDTLLQPALNDR